MNSTLIAAAVSAALAGSIGFGAAWTLQGRTIDALRIEAKDAIIIQQRATREATERASADIRKAQEGAANRIAALNRELADTRKSADSLRDTSSAAVRTATDSPATCASIVATFGDVFAESRSFIQEVVADADRCQSNLQLMHDAWAKK